MLRLFWRFAALAVAAVVVYHLWIFAQVWYWIDHNPATTAFMEARRDFLQAKSPGAKLQQRWVPYGRISTHLKRAVVAAEDAKFVGHDGFDWDGIQKALEKNMQRGKVVAGGSTISQQLAKNLFLSAERSAWRKAEEALITLLLERVLGKRRILEIYLNVVEWGNGVFGAEAAARHYYGISAAELSPGQSARLAGMLPAPRYYDGHRNAPGLAKKSAVSLARMPAVQIP